jgi:hypothetical protein
MSKYKSTLLLVILIMTSCAPQHVDVLECIKETPDGFWIGLWHGTIAPITFIISLFSDSVEMYSVNNNGGWYNFGFLLGIGGLTFGSTSKK